MTNDTLFQYFTSVKQQIIDAAMQKGISANGSMLSSLQVVETPAGYDLQADNNIYFIEYGRGPTTSPKGNPGNPDLVQIIQDWIDAKGLDLNPYAVANAIHKNGTRLYRAGGNSGILSVPLQLDTLNDAFNNIANQYLQNTAADVFGPLLSY